MRIRVYRVDNTGLPQAIYYLGKLKNRLVWLHETRMFSYECYNYPRLKLAVQSNPPLTYAYAEFNEQEYKQALEKWTNQS